MCETFQGGHNQHPTSLQRRADPGLDYWNRNFGHLGLQPTSKESRTPRKLLLPRKKLGKKRSFDVQHTVQIIIKMKVKVGYQYSNLFRSYKMRLIPYHSDAKQQAKVLV
jgi:hypothetical protein